MFGSVAPTLSGLKELAAKCEKILRALRSDSKRKDGME